jgi:hypothetical protein
MPRLVSDPREGSNHVELAPWPVDSYGPIGVLTAENFESWGPLIEQRPFSQRRRSSR